MHTCLHIFLSIDCYSENDLGIHYNETVNVTESNRTCQAWDSDTPHFHPLTSLYRPYLEKHNYCRNPEGRGSRPWCYTTDPNVRWEYCNIRNCAHTDDSNGARVTAVVTIVVPILVIALVVIVVILFSI